MDGVSNYTSILL